MAAKDAEKDGMGFLWILDLVVAFALIQILGLGPALAMFAAHSLLKRRLGYPLSLVLSLLIGLLVYLALVSILLPQGAAL